MAFNNIDDNYDPAYAANAVVNNDDMTQAMDNMVNQLARLAPTLGAVIGNANPTPGEQAALGDALRGIADASAQTKAAAELRKQRTEAKTKIKIYSTLPVMGQNVALPAVRDYKVLDFTGEKGCKTNCLGFLRQVLNQCQASGLTNAACIAMIDRHTQGLANSVARIAAEEDGDLEEVVRRLEIRFAALDHPEEAYAACQRIVRNSGEDLNELGFRIREQASMATRELPVATKTAEAQKLSKRVFRGLLSTMVQTQVDTNELTRLQAGHPPFKYADYVSNAATIEKQYGMYNARLTNQPGIQATDATGAAFAVRPAIKQPTSTHTVAFQTPEPKTEPSEDLQTVIHLLKEVAEQTKQNYQTSGLATQEQPHQTLANPVYSGQNRPNFNSQNAPRQNNIGQMQESHQGNNGYFRRNNQQGDYHRSDNHNDDYPSRRDRFQRNDSQNDYDRPRQSRRDRSYSRDNNYQNHQNDYRDNSRGRYDPRNRSNSRGRNNYSRGNSPYPRQDNQYNRRDSSANRVVYNPKLFNVEPHECLKCGIAGHSIRDGSKCYLHRYPLASEPCSKCKKGAHLAQTCVASAMKSQAPKN